MLTGFALGAKYSSLEPSFDMLVIKACNLYHTHGFAVRSDPSTRCGLLSDDASWSTNCATRSQITMLNNMNLKCKANYS
ncbi:hypothetical protein BpHYR1_035105 [Brachionus plicatilis]|uniref:Uncharacterized protein n=1 Tax=Brachionus plicatilis TaxID=10195 RepID=A0A3M7P3Q5_BRAPC|nr:hypothetical protein BpHYR1_035105 [Brachionus plicatilis]